MDYTDAKLLSYIYIIIGIIPNPLIKELSTLRQCRGSL